MGTRTGLTLIAVACSVGACARADSKPYNRVLPVERMFDIQLRPGAIALRHDVERAYGFAVQEERVPGFSGVNGMSTRISGTRLTLEGAPVLQLVPGTDPVSIEDTIVHELSHMKLIAEGYPIVIVAPTDVGDAPYLKFFAAYVMDPILHAVFYPHMRAIGIDPMRDERPTLDNIETITGWRSDFSGIDDTVRALNFFKLVMESADHRVEQRLRDRYRQLGWTTALRLADQVLAMAALASPWSAQSVASVVEDVLRLTQDTQRPLRIERQSVTRGKIVLHGLVVSRVAAP